MMAVPCSQLFATTAGTIRADELAALVPADGWQRAELRRRRQGTAAL